MSDNNFEYHGGETMRLVKISPGFVMIPGKETRGLALFVIDKENPGDVLADPITSPQQVVAMIHAMIGCATIHFGQEDMATAIESHQAQARAVQNSEDLPPEKRPN